MIIFGGKIQLLGAKSKSRLQNMIKSKYIRKYGQESRAFAKP